MTDIAVGDRALHRVLITGAGGAIGTAIWEFLADLGIAVTGLSLDPVAAPPEGRLILGDATSRGDLASALEGVDTIVHLAAIPHPAHGTPYDVYRTNVTATFNVLSAAGESGIDRIVISSSINAFGVPFNPNGPMPEYFPLDESIRTDIADAYSLSKYSGEIAAAMAARRWGVDVVSLRFPLVKFEAVLREAAAEYSASPALGVREGWSYLETRDAVRAIVAAVTRPIRGAHVVGLSAADTLLDVPTEEALARYAPGVRVRHPLPGFTSAIDTERARTLLGFEPRYSLRATTDQAHQKERQ